MNTQKLTVIIVTLFMLITSCTKNDEEVQIPKKSTYLLSKITYSASSNITFSCDENNRLMESNSIRDNASPSKTTFQYNSKGKISEALTIVPLPGNSLPKNKIIYTYDAQDRLIEKKTFSNSFSSPGVFTISSTENFIYLANTIQYKFTQANASFPTKIDNYDLDSNGNFSSIFSYKNITQSSPYGILDWKKTVEYDSKNNPLSNIPDEYLFLEKTKNNQTKSTSAQLTPGVSTTTYEYNADGYPTKSTIGNSTTTYEYIVK